MIAPLRRRHRVLWTVLALVVPALYVAALVVRPAPPRMDPLPAVLADPAPAGRVLFESDQLFTDQLFTEPTINVRMRAGDDGPVLELAPQAPVVKPEVLVYWTPSGGEGDVLPPDTLPKDAWLLGALAGTRVRAFPLPAAAHQGGGHLLLYSLGHQEMVARAELPVLAELAIPTESPAPGEDGP